ncbi:hypothetical protein [Streptomyces sp. NPDC006134]|uniref:hypothetical protein n=1 Tax=Streptomyces sp. NPDC006134 TaxID=3154467 RepID=UPI0033CD66F5
MLDVEAADPYRNILMNVFPPLLGPEEGVRRLQAWPDCIFVHIPGVDLLKENIQDLYGWIGDWFNNYSLSLLFDPDATRPAALQSNLDDSPVLRQLERLVNFLQIGLSGG